MPNAYHDREEKRRRLREAARRAAKRADQLLTSELNALRKATRADLEELRPKITAKATYDKLIKVVAASTRRNESIAQLKSRLETLGKVGVRTVKKIITELAKLK